MAAIGTEGFHLPGEPVVEGADSYWPREVADMVLFHQRESLFVFLSMLQFDGLPRPRIISELSYPLQLVSIQLLWPGKIVIYIDVDDDEVQVIYHIGQVIHPAMLAMPIDGDESHRIVSLLRRCQSAYCLLAPCPVLP